MLLTRKPAASARTARGFSSVKISRLRRFPTVTAAKSISAPLPAAKWQRASLFAQSAISTSEIAGTAGGIFFENSKNAARRIAANIICGWNSEIAAHIGLLPLNESEKAIFDKYGGISNEVMYGATLIVGCLTEKGCFGLQIGDGNFCVLDNGEMTSPVPEDAKLVGNLTTSLCDSDAISSFRFFYREGDFSGIVLSSDGLINSFLNESDFYSFGKRVLSAVENGSTNALAEHLKTRSRCGSRDDISVAAIV